METAIGEADRRAGLAQGRLGDLAAWLSAPGEASLFEPALADRAYWLDVRRKADADRRAALAGRMAAQAAARATALLLDRASALEAAVRAARRRALRTRLDGADEREAEERMGGVVQP